MDHGDFQGNLTWELVDLQVPEPQMPETTFEMGNHTLQSHPLGTSWAPMTCSGVFSQLPVSLSLSVSCENPWL